MEIKYRTQLGELLNHFGLSGDAVEIGVAEGRNAEVLISQPAIKKLYLIDAWQRLEQAGDGANDQNWHDRNYKEAQERVSKFKEKAVFLKGLSQDMIKQIPDDSLVLAYIDGDHSYEGALRDLRAIYSKVKRGGIIAGHDYLNLSYGVNQAVTEFLENRTYLKLHVIKEDEDSMASFWFVK